MTEKLTMDKVKTLLSQIVVEHMESGEFAPFKKLKDEILGELGPFVKQEDLKELNDAIEKLRNLPGPNGAGDIDPSDSHLKGLKPNGGYECMAEFAKDVYRAGAEGAAPSERWGKWFADVKAYNEVVKAAGSPTLEIADPEAGGYLVPPEFSRTLLERGFENSNYVNRCTKVPMQINQIGMPYVKDFDHSSGYVFGALAAYWKDELAEKTATNPEFGKTTLALNKLIVLVFSSDELLEDSIISMEPLLQGMAGDAIGWKVDKAILRGTGAGQPLGATVAANPSRIVQAKYGSQDADTIVYENVVQMYARMWGRGKKNAVWVANNDAFPQLALMKLDVGTGGSAVYIPANGAAGRPYDTLMGRELITCEHAPTLGDEGDLSYIDFSQYLIGQKRGRGAGVQYASSIHLKFDYDQTAFRFVLRLDGQPWWPAVFTPENGSTQSPFVTLAERGT